MNTPTEAQVVEYVKEHGPVPVGTVAKALGCDKSEVNSVLYRLKGRRVLSCDGSQPPLWSDAGKEVGASKAGGPGGKAGKKSVAVKAAERKEEVGHSGAQRHVLPVAGTIPRVPRPTWRAPVSKAAASAAPRVPDPDQDGIIRSPSSARLMVEAGPGYGKTEVACARVADLLGRGLTGAQILLLSFTRTAVKEMRERIGQLAASNGDVRGVDIRTIDSFAWEINRGLAADGVADLGGYAESIARSLAVLRNTTERSGDVEEAVGRYRHVLVDEAQDLVGIRAEWMIAFLSRLSPETGWTVFMDPAQAIYDWAEEEGGDEKEPTSFVKVHGDTLGRFERRVLRTFYRTKNAELSEFLQAVRKVVPYGGSAGVPSNLRGNLLYLAEGSGNDEDIYGLWERARTDADGGLILFRSRAEALSASSYLLNESKGHRLRFGGLPRLMAPWVAAVVNRIGRMSFGRVDFEAGWLEVERSCPYLTSDWSMEEGWTILSHLGRHPGGPAGRVREVIVEALADRLAQRRVPDGLFRKELGPDGPIIGTVHGSKGREAGHVVVAVSDRASDEAREAEEERVLYVGVSRARNNLELVKAPQRQWYYHSDGRAWRKGRDCVRMEVGRDGDLDPVASAHADQSLIASFDGSFRRVRMKSSQCGKRWERRLLLEDDSYIGTLSMSCADQLNEIMQKACRRFCNGLAYLQWIDVTTVAIGSADSRVQDLPDAVRRTRLWLVPIVVGIGYAKTK